jgi:hypothetical protein
MCGPQIAARASTSFCRASIAWRAISARVRAADPSNVAPVRIAHPNSVATHRVRLATTAPPQSARCNAPWGCIARKVRVSVHRALPCLSWYHHACAVRWKPVDGVASFPANACVGVFCVLNWPSGSKAGISCHQGTYCPPGSSTNTPCLGGYFCTTPASQMQCASGNFCPPGSQNQQTCSSGSYCLAGSSSNADCPAGYIVRYTMG